MKLSDRIAEILVENKIENVFMVTGGMAMHLNDSLTRNQKISTTFFHHEQACAMAAEGYYRASGKIPVVCVTAGPGGINALNGVFGAFADSIPVLILSGQVRTDTIKKSSKLRQLGDQEAPITEIVKPITKYSKLVDGKTKIEKELEIAFSNLLSGRKGPVWLDIPINIQSKEVEKHTFSKNVQNKAEYKNLEKNIEELIYKLKTSKRPVVIAGGGIRNSSSLQSFLQFVKKLNIPVVTAFNGHDLLYEKHNNFVGRCGTIGDRRGNLVVECADLIIVCGSSLNIRQIGYNYKSFGKNKFFCYVDIDKNELKKKTINKNIDLAINSDLDLFFCEFNKRYKVTQNQNHIKFLKWCKVIKSKYSIKNENYIKTNKINPYLFTKELSSISKNSDIIITSNATAAIVPHQSFIIKKGQRFFTNSTSGSMGYGICSAIGASISNPKRRILCFEGDGSLQMNIQELATISHNNLNIVLIVFSNGGYHSIRQTQKNYFSDNLVGIDPETGISFPNLKFIAKAYNLNYENVNINNIVNFFDSFNYLETPIIINVEVDKNINFQPRIMSRRDTNGKIISPELYDMHPFLSNKELEIIFSIKNQ